MRITVCRVMCKQLQRPGKKASVLQQLSVATRAQAARLQTQRRITWPGGRDHSVGESGAGEGEHRPARTCTPAPRGQPKTSDRANPDHRQRPVISHTSWPLAYRVGRPTQVPAQTVEEDGLPGLPPPKPEPRWLLPGSLEKAGGQNQLEASSFREKGKCPFAGPSWRTLAACPLTLTQ